MSDQIFIGLGSSLGNGTEIFASAQKFLEKKDIKIVQKSNILKNPPIGGVAKNEFSNAVWEIAFNRSPEELLMLLQECERAHGRPKTHKYWGDRTLDLDILIWEEKIINTPNLKIPHPEIPNRNFVLLPLSELVDENFEIPTFGALNTLIK